MPQVPEVVRELHGRRLRTCRVALAHLRPAGQPGLDEVPARPVRHAAAQLLEELGTLRPRPHQRHLAAEDVPQLRKLVEPRSAHEGAGRRDARVVGPRPDGLARTLGVGAHRPELVDRECLAVLAEPDLAQEHRSRRPPHEQREQREEREREHAQHQRSGDVHRPLGVARVRAAVEVEHAHEPLVRQVLDRHPPERVLVELGELDHPEAR